MLKKMKKQLTEDINKARESGELTVRKVYEISYEAVSQTVLTINSGVKDLSGITWEAMATSIQALKDAEEASEDNIAAAIQGTVEGIKQAESEMLDITQNEIDLGKNKIQQGEEKMAEAMHEVFDGAKEAATGFTGEVRTHIETAITDAKLKSAEFMGLTQDAVKEAVLKAIKSGTDVEETIINVTRNATSKALAETHFNADRVRKVSKTVLAAALDAAEDPISTVTETASAAVEGVRQGLIRSINFTHDSFEKVDVGLKKFVAKDLQQTKDDLEAVEDIFVETLRKAANKSETVAKDILHELADDAKKAGSSLRKHTVAASHSVDKHLKEMGDDEVHKTEDKTK